MFSNHAYCCLFQMFASNMHQNQWFQVRFFKNFLGRGSPSPFPRPLPRFFSGFALGSSFALNSQALCAFDSGFALDFQALRALDSGFALNFRLLNLVNCPPKLNSWIRHWPLVAFGGQGPVARTSAARDHLPGAFTFGRLRQPKLVYCFSMSRCWQICNCRGADRMSWLYGEKIRNGGRFVVLK